MGSLSPALTGLTSTLGTIRTLVNTIEGPTSSQSSQKNTLLAEQDLALRQLQAKQQADSQADAAQAALQRQQVAAANAADAAQRMATLRAAVARQRASYGAHGLGVADGSSQAVLLGLYQQSDQEQADQDRIDGLRLAAIDQNLDSQNGLNVLARTQLIQQQKLKQLSEGF